MTGDPVQRFETTIELGGTTATGFEVPTAAVEALGSGKKPRVHVTIGGHAYRSTVAVYGDRFMLPLNAQNRNSAGVEAGDRVTVELRLDTEPRTVSVPAELQEALVEVPGAAEKFAALSYSKRRQAVTAIEEAKTDETRRRRVRKTAESLR